MYVPIKWKHKPRQTCQNPKRKFPKTTTTQQYHTRTAWRGKMKLRTSAAGALTVNSISSLIDETGPMCKLKEEHTDIKKPHEIYKTRVHMFVLNQNKTIDGLYRCYTFVTSSPSHIPSQTFEPNHQPHLSWSDSKIPFGKTNSIDSKATLDTSFFMQHLHARLLLNQPCKTAYALSFELMGIYILNKQNLRKWYWG